MDHRIVPIRQIKMALQHLQHQSSEGSISECLGEAVLVIEDLISRLDSLPNEHDVDGLLLRIDILKTNLVSLNVDDDIFGLLDLAYNWLTNANRHPCGEGENPNRPTNTKRGRPSFDIQEDQLFFLLEQGFKVADISRILGVGKRTVERKMSSLGLSVAGNCRCDFHTTW